MAAGRAALLEVLTPEAFERTAALGERMAAGCGRRSSAPGCRGAWSSTAPTPSTSSCPTPPIDGAGSRAADDPDLRALIRVFMANRGVWESGWWLGPTVSVAHGPDDVDRYVATFDDFLTEVT